MTRDFGNKELRDVDSSKVPPGETVMRYLQRKFTVTTRYGGGFVQSLEGLSGGKDVDGRPVDWFYYVNGIEAGNGAASRKIAVGDQIWWDRHDWGAAQRIPAVVGSWPEPFVSGTEGKKIPLALVCAGERRSCDEVQTRLNDEGVTGISQAGHRDRDRSEAAADRGRPMVEGPQRAGGADARARAGGVGRVRAAGRPTASSCSTSAARSPRSGRAPSGWWRRRASGSSSRPGS